MNYTSSLSIDNYSVNPHLAQYNLNPHPYPLNPNFVTTGSHMGCMSPMGFNAPPVQRQFSYPGYYYYAPITTESLNFSLIETPRSIMKTAFPDQAVIEFSNAINRPAVLINRTKRLIYGPEDCIDHLRRPIISLRWIRGLFN
ncbi:MAG: hypothetical protein ACK41P_02475 [Asticcacaulis sp.]